MKSDWQFWIDVGGTFTDCIGIDPDGNKHFAKVLSSGHVHGSLVRQNSDWFSHELRSYAKNFWAGSTINFRSEPESPSGNALRILSNVAGILEFQDSESQVPSRFGRNQNLLAHGLR